MKTLHTPGSGLVFGLPALVILTFSPVSADILTWNNSSADGKWSTNANWDGGVRPVADDDAVFPAGLGGTVGFNIVPGYIPIAQSIQFNDNYTVGGDFNLNPSGMVDIGVNGGSLVTFGAFLDISGLTKIGAGTLILTNANNVTGVTVSGGTLRTTAAAGLTGASLLNGGTFEIGPNVLTFPAPITMAGASTLRSLGTTTTQGTLTIDPAATSITFGTTDVSDILQVTDATNEISGGSAATVIQVTGPGTVRPGGGNLFPGSWQVNDGLLDIRPATTGVMLGNNPAGSITFSGGDFRVRSDSGPMNLTNSQANNIALNTDTTFTSERLSPSFGVTHTVGSTTLGSHTFTILPGASVNTGGAGFEMTRLTLTGNPVLALPGTASAGSKLIIDLIDGGATPRAITVTGDGDLTFQGSGTNVLVDGSTLSVTGGGNLLLDFPPIGPGPVTPVTMGQNPIGDADLSMTDGTLLLRGSSTGTIFSLPTDLTLGGTVTVDAARNVSGSGNVVFRMASITLKPATVLSISGDNSFGLGSEGPLVLQGNATLQGFNSGTTADGVCFLYGGISGGPGSAVTIGNTSRPINLTIDAPSTYGGGTVMNGGNVTLSTANGFGTGQTTLNGGNLVLGADAALNGTVSLNGGALVVNGPNVLAANPVQLNGGTLDLRTNANAAAAIPSLTVSGTAAINTTRVSSSGSALLTIPVIDVTGNTSLTVTAASSVTSLLSGFDLSGDLTLNSSSATRVTSITEDGTPRKFIKTGGAQLDLEGVSTHSGGTEVLAGTLYVENSGALGSGALTIGATSGTAAATVRFVENLTIPNDIVVRSGNSGLMTIDAETGRLTWNGNVDLQKSVTLDNGSSTAADLSYFNGVVSGAGDITKTSGGEIVLSNAANSFGSGAPTSVSISAGTLTVASNGALGNAANGVNLTSSGILKVTGTFSTPRTFTVTGTTSDVNVTSGNTLTVNSPFAGTGTFNKGDLGTLEIGPAVDATARGSAITAALGGVLRVQGQKNLGDASPITVDGGSFAFHRDANTNFGHPVTVVASGGLHVDRAVGGAGSNGRHTLGAVSTTSTATLTVTGDNGYGLSLGAYTATNSSGVINNAPGTLLLASVTGNPATSARTLTLGGSGNIDITGALSEGAGTGTYALTKAGPGTLRLGTSVADFARITTVTDGTLDLNGLNYAVDDLTVGFGNSALGAKLVTGAGSIILGDDLTFSNSVSSPGASFTGNLVLTGVAHDFAIANTGTAPVDLLIDGPISGSPGATILKSGGGTLRLTGAGNTLPGLVTLTEGVIELAKSSGHGIGASGFTIATTSADSTVRLLAADQIENSAPVSLGGASEVFFDLNNFTETVGPLSLAQTDNNDYTAVKTGATGTLVLNGNLTLNNNINSSSNEERNVLITGTGSETVPAFNGFLDLGGVNRTIHVATTTVGTNEPKANATIETQIINGGIVKTGPRTLFLTHPNNSFAGGLQIAQGFVRPGGTTSLGLGPVTFTNAPGTLAGIDFGSLSGTVANTIVTGTGDFTFTYAAPAPNVLTLAGGFDLEQNLTVNVVNGSVQNGTPTEVFRAVVDVTGTIDDAAGNFGLTKVGDGMLKLAAGNTYGGASLVERGILSLAADSSLGDTTVPLTLNGGCLGALNSFTLTRDLVIGANGGSLRADFSRTMEIGGPLDWGSATTGTDGSGRIVISGPTTGSGNLKVGEAIAFAAGTLGQQLTWNVEVCLQGPAALPSGNLSLDGYGILKLGNGNFTRPLGTGPGEVQLPSNSAGGWAAVGADRIVNIGGAGDPMTWGQVSPPFLYRDGPSTSDYGQLILGSFTATHTVEFQNNLVFPPGASFSINRQVTCWDGAAAVDGRITGDAIQNDPIKRGVFSVSGNGTLEMAGDLIGNFGVTQNGDGTTILSGNNTGLAEDIAVFEGTLVLANDASLGTPSSIVIFPGTFHSELDASALTSPLTLGQSGSIGIYGLITGDVRVNGSLIGTGAITGDVTVPAGSYVYSETQGTLEITGDLTLETGGSLDFSIDGTVPETQHTRLRVNGEVNLSGNLYAGESGTLLDGESVVLILNDGTDPINGTFDYLPEGWGFSLGNGRALQVTYQANGDGGPIGNDFGVKLVPDTFSTDLVLSVDAPLVVDLGAAFTATYTIENAGPNLSQGASFEMSLPPGATFNGSTPTGSVNSGQLSIPVSALTNAATTSITLAFTAPLAPGTILLDAQLQNPSDSYNGNNYSPALVAVLPGGNPVIDTFNVDLVNDQATLGIEALQGVRYLLEGSLELENWYDIEEFIGNGAPYEIVQPMDETEEFFRFRILPYNGGGGGSVEAE